MRCAPFARARASCRSSNEWIPAAPSLNLALRLHQAGVPVIGTSPDSIDLAEDRKRFGALLHELGIPQPENGMAATGAEAIEVAGRIGYPVLVRPSYVLGGRAMAIVY